MSRNVKSAKKWCALVIPVLVKAVRDMLAQKVFTNVTFVEKRFARSAPHNVMIAGTFFAKSMPEKCSHVPNVESGTVLCAILGMEYMDYVKRKRNNVVK